MRIVRLVLGVAIIAMLGIVWQRHTTVAEAYRVERAPIQFRFDGLDFEVQLDSAAGASPLAVPRAPDTKDVILPAVEGVSPTTTPTAIVGSGSMRFTGTVTGPDGPVPGAIVRLEHHRVDGTDTVDAVADPDGVWTVDQLPGGRWLIRAFVPELFASLTPRLAFYPAAARAQVDLTVGAADPAPVVEITGAGLLDVGATGTAAVTVGHRRIDENGIIVIDPTPGAVIDAVTGPGGAARIVSAASTRTSAAGAALFAVTCDAAGQASVAVSVAIPAATNPAPGIASPPTPLATTTATTVTTATTGATATAALATCVVPAPPTTIGPEVGVDG